VRLLKKLFYGIAFLIMACCVLILVCALNPALTEDLSEMLGLEENATVVGENIGAGVLEDAQNDIIADSVNTTSKPIEVGYIPPAEDAVVLPEQVYGKSDYEPVRSNEKLLEDEEAEALMRSSLPMGEVGEYLTFDSRMYPYYAMLDEDLQMLYRQIYANALEQKKAFAPVITVGIERVKDVFEAVYNDHPELFWLETEYSCKYTQKGICLEISLCYNDTVKDLEEAQKKFEEQAQLILDGAVKQASDYDKEVYVHDALVKRVEYRANAKMSQSAYSALVNGESVCAGYARAFQYLMQQLNIPCYYCTGYSGEDHAWNIIELKRNYYNVDVTWDDTKPTTYDFLNKTDIDFAQTHVRKSLSVYLPACTGGTLVAANTNSEDTLENISDDTTSQEEIAGSNLDAYINPDPQEPLTYPDGLYPNGYVDEEAKAQREKEENLKKAGITEAAVMDDMTEYYADCLKQMVEVGTGQKYFTNVVPKSLWSTVEKAYGQGSYEEGYVKKALEQMEMEHFAIQLQVDDLSGGYYRIYHNIYTW